MEGNLGPTCIVCTENISSSDGHLVTWCGHIWCRLCVNKRFIAACHEEGSFPPRCCNEIDFHQAQPLLDDEVAVLFIQKDREYRSIERLYCHDVRCQQLIQLSPIRHGKVHCEKCGLDTCTRCKGNAHDGICPKDPAHEDFMEAVAQAGFQQCSKCSRVIEKVSGCNHIVCKCKFQFCYKCGLQWKTCYCAQVEDFQWLDLVVQDGVQGMDIEYERRLNEIQRMENELIRNEIERARTFAMYNRRTAHRNPLTNRAINPTDQEFEEAMLLGIETVDAAAAVPTQRQRNMYPRVPAYDPSRPYANYGAYYDAGQLHRRDAFYVPGPQAPVGQDIPNQYHPAWNQLNANLQIPFAGVPQQMPAPNHYRRRDFSQGSRRVNYGNLTCNVCAESMPNYIWRCMGCSWQECERCRGPRPTRTLFGDRMSR